MNSKNTHLINKYIRFFLISCVLSVHYTTRTPLIILYYVYICFALYGPSSFISNTIFVLTSAILLISLFLVILFNWKMSKEWAINVIGRGYYEKYVSHSWPGVKSLLVAICGFGSVCAVETRTSGQYHLEHLKNVQSMSDRAEKRRFDGDHVGASNIEYSINRLEEAYKHGGLFSRAVNRVAVNWNGGAQPVEKPNPNPRIFSSEDMKDFVFKDFKDN